MLDKNMTSTQYFKVDAQVDIPVDEILDRVYHALQEKGYNPINQIVGYIMSGDPTYITSYNGARALLCKVERDELVEEMFTKYIENKGWTLE